eukprot:10781958-Alexandrium_andersonii.AAC.1
MTGCPPSTAAAAQHPAAGPTGSWGHCHGRRSPVPAAACASGCLPFAAHRRRTAASPSPPPPS